MNNPSKKKVNWSEETKGQFSKVIEEIHQRYCKEEEENKDVLLMSSMILVYQGLLEQGEAAMLLNMTEEQYQSCTIPYLSPYK